MAGGFFSRGDMKRLTILSAILAAFGTGVVLWQRNALSEAHAEIGAVSAAGPTGDAQVGDATLQQEIAALRELTKDLPKLRNEISQLRSDGSKLAALRAEHAWLLEAKQTGSQIPRESPAGFVSRDNLLFAGRATPEAALQSFFWALREGNMMLVMQAMPVEDGEISQWEQISASERAKAEEEFKASGEVQMMKQFTDFAVVGREDISNDKVILHLRSSVATNTFPHALKRFGNEWKITGVGASQMPRR
jgi:hypothetical protein